MLTSLIKIDRGPSKSKGENLQTGEDGYILIAVLFMVVLVLIALSIAAPKVAADIQRDREVELMHRGMQYRRAIKLYYKKFGAYPPNMDALEKTSEIRFLRRRYKDPETGKDEWHLIHFGENKTPTVMGFFGQALGGTNGSTLAGTGPGGIGQSIGSPAGGSAFGGGPLGGSSIGGTSFGGASGGGASGGSSIFGNTPGTGTTDPNSGTSGNVGAGGAASGSATTSPAGSPTDPNSTSGTTQTAGGSIFGGSTSNGQTFGGGGIIGVESTSPKPSILEYKKKKHFNEWEFVYDPQQDQMQLSNNTGTVGQPMSGAGNSTTGSPNTPSLFNQTPGSTIAPTVPTTPTQPVPPGTSSPQ